MNDYLRIYLIGALFWLIICRAPQSNNLGHLLEALMWPIIAPILGFVVIINALDSRSHRDD